MTEHWLKYSFELQITDEVISVISDYFSSEEEYSFYATGYVIAKDGLKPFMEDALSLPNNKSNMFYCSGMRGLNPRENELQFRMSYLIKNEDTIKQALENAFNSVLVVSNGEDGDTLYEGDLQIN